jgi:hypothetical protein
MLARAATTQIHFSGTDIMFDATNAQRPMALAQDNGP